MKHNISEHIAKLRAAEAAKPAVADNSIIFWGTPLDKSFLPLLNTVKGSASIRIKIANADTLVAVRMYCKTHRTYRVLSTNISLLKLLLSWDKRAAPSLADYAGSYFTIPAMTPEEPDIEIVFMQPLKQLATVTYGKFMAKRNVAKFAAASDWFTPPPFLGYTLLTPANQEANYQTFQQPNCFLIAVDVETLKEFAQIRCLSYTAFFTDSSTPSGFHAESVVLALDSDWALATMRNWNHKLQAPKVMQGGRYDAAYFCRYSAPLHNYLYDTANMMHCIYSELPKDLGFLGAFWIRETFYHKDLADTSDLDTYYRYNALDTYLTGCVLLAMMKELPTYASNNYLAEFPMTFPCHLSEMTGIARDMDSLDVAKKQQQLIVDTEQRKLDTIFSVPNGEHLNVLSPPQMKQLLTILGCKDLKTTGADDLKKAANRHPLNARVISLVTSIREARKLVSTYISAGKEFYPGLLEGSNRDPSKARILYGLSPHSTDTSRLASKSHHFWCGVNIQNIPRGKIVKQTYKADPDFMLFEIDYAQAESRDTAYISGDQTLIENVENSPDFHSYNASKFFGTPFEEIFDVATGEVLLKELRQLAKPVNHGANYNMQARTLTVKIGDKKLAQARKMLQLPRTWSYIEIAQYLLDQFHRTYPGIAGTMYAGVKKEVAATGLIASTAQFYCDSPEDYNPDNLVGLTRYCFGDPAKSSPVHNAYIAHPPQSLNAMTLNKAYMKVFREVAMHPKHSKNFKLCCQVHDSILGQHRIGHDYIKDIVAELMDIPVTLVGYDGVVRTFRVPTDASNSATPWSGIK